MEVKIGVVYTPRELIVETEDDATTVAGAIETAVRDGATVVWFTDKKGRRVGVPTDKIAYIELGSDAGDNPVGFGTR